MQQFFAEQKRRNEEDARVVLAIRVAEVTIQFEAFLKAARQFLR